MSGQRGTRTKRRASKEHSSDDENDLVVVKRSALRARLSDSPDENDVEMQFTQQAPEPSQPILPAKKSEKANLETLGNDNKNKAVSDLSRMLLFRALAGEPIDRLKCAKEALADFHNERITSAAFEEAATNLRNVFGFELRRVPKFMEKRKDFPAKFTDRLYVINEVADDAAGTHSKAIHSVHADRAIEKGLLMIVLAFCFCKGDPRADGSRWITELDLFRLLHGLDESIPELPPSNRRASKQSTSHFHDGAGISQTPNVDVLIDAFVHMDYLLRDKDAEKPNGDRECIVYSMGPRAAMEIGRRQVIYFCAEILDEEPDPTMLAEIEAANEEETEEYNEAR